MKMQEMSGFPKLKKAQIVAMFGIILPKPVQVQQGVLGISSLNHHLVNIGFGRKKELIKGGKRELYKYVVTCHDLSGTKLKEFLLETYGLGKSLSCMLKVVKIAVTPLKNPKPL
jgi:hypothetical protein